MSSANNPPYLEKVTAFSFDAVYSGIRYTIVPKEFSDNTGDFIAQRFDVYENLKATPKYSVTIKITGTVRTLWQLGINPSIDVKSEVANLGNAKIALMLEEETLNNHQEITFISNEAVETIALQTYLLKQQHNNVINSHRTRLQQVQDSFGKNLEIITNYEKDYVNFKQKNAAEIRAIILQLASVSAVIVAGILALNPSVINGWVIISLICFIAVGFAPLYVYRLLEDGDIFLFNQKNKFQTEIERLKEKESKFMINPSVKGYDDLYVEYENSYKGKTEGPKNIRRDKIAIGIQVIFGVALIFLCIGYITHKEKIINMNTEKLERVMNQPDKTQK